MSRRFAVYCKSFRDDFGRLDNLIRSWKKHGSAIPLLLSVPKKDIGILHDSVEIPNGVWVIADESYIPDDEYTKYGWMHQQICKMGIHRTNFADSYYIIDSDSYFINDLTSANFVDGQGRLRIVAHPIRTKLSPKNGTLVNFILRNQETTNSGGVELLDRLSFMDNLQNAREAHAKNASLVAGDRRKYISEAFGLEQSSDLNSLNWGPNPIFHREILEGIQTEISQIGMNLRSLIYLAPWEYEWYGLYALRRFSEPISPCISSCVHFAADNDVQFAREQGITANTLSERFISIAMASRHFDLTEF